MTNDKIRWGVIGAANIAKVAVIPAIQTSSNGEVVAIASRDLAKAKTFAAKFGIPRAYSKYDELLKARDIDAVYIPLPNSLHREWTIRAAEMRKHILCEKPLGLNAQECLEMEAVANQYGVKLMEAFMYRFHPRTERACEMAQNGAIGELRMIQSAFTFKLTRPDNIRLMPELGGGALMDVGCYCINISRMAAGMEPAEVQAFARWSSSGVDEQMIGALIFSNGIMAQFDCALTMERREEYLLAGTDGFLHVPQAFLPGEEAVMIEQVSGRNEITQHWIEGVNEYRLMVEHFAECVLHDLPLRYTANEAAANMRVIEALYRSARNLGKPEVVPSI
ncbi:MAG: Gfo/Idh/MocA family oxidoreductase [Anaerolineales bacterium]|nr:Gfo/Idh/MocA family oxidoreductase [Anaerolineales bacterium]